MKPPPFDYYAAGSVDEALRLLGEIGEEAMPLAGGQTLVPLLNMRLARPAALVDLNPAAELANLQRTGSEFRIGAMVRHMTLESDAELRRHLPLVAEAARHIAHLQIRTRGTIGGSLANAAPAAEWPAVVAALDADLVLRSAAGGARTVKPAGFFAGAMQTTLAPGELLVEIRLPIPDPATGWAFVEFARRHGDFALAGAAALVRLGAGGRVEEARLAMCGLAAPGVRLTAAETALRGRAVAEATLEEIEAIVRRTAEVADDFQMSGDSRRQVAGVIARRALERAAERARGGARGDRRPG